jgi:hypothetical protein
MKTVEKHTQKTWDQVFEENHHHWRTKMKPTEKYVWKKQPSLKNILDTFTMNTCAKFNRGFIEYARHLNAHDRPLGSPFHSLDRSWLDNHLSHVKWFQENGFLETEPVIKNCCHCGFPGSLRKSKKQVWCTNCGMRGARGTTAQAIKHWNTVMEHVEANTLRIQYISG